MSPRRDRKSETTPREKWPQKTAFLLASYQLQVSEDWVVETVNIELAAHHAVIELVSKSESGTGIFNAETRRKNRVMCRQFVSRDRASQKNWPTCL
jgi:hypothetical protein